jgi:hypothetical protein
MIIGLVTFYIFFKYIWYLKLDYIILNEGLEKKTIWGEQSISWNGIENIKKAFSVATEKSEIIVELKHKNKIIIENKLNNYSSLIEHIQDKTSVNKIGTDYCFYFRRELKLLLIISIFILLAFLKIELDGYMFQTGIPLGFIIYFYYIINYFMKLKVDLQNNFFKYTLVGISLIIILAPTLKVGFDVDAYISYIAGIMIGLIFTLLLSYLSVKLFVENEAN